MGNEQEFRPFKPFAIEALAHLGYQLSIDPQSRAKIHELKNTFRQSSDLSFIVYINHLAYGDPLFAADIASKIKTKDQPIIAPTSYSHTDPDNPKNQNFYKMVQLASWAGINVIRVIQSYQVNNPEFNYSQIDAAETTANFLKTVKAELKNHQSVGIIISPEGHRSDDGSLGKFETGFAKIARLFKDVIYIPLAIIYPNGYQRNKLNLMRKVQLTIGETTRAVNGEVNQDVLHDRLQEILPPQHR